MSQLFQLFGLVCELNTSMKNDLCEYIAQNLVELHSRQCVPRNTVSQFERPTKAVSIIWLMMEFPLR